MGGDSIPGLVVAAPMSGSGKTTVALGLMAAFRRRGLKVAPFKTGPDFIDPGHHARVTGMPGRNLDGWMTSRETCREIFARAARDADIAVVEGAMGLFDGADAKTGAGSTAEMAKWLGLPVLLVADARSMARSFAALVSGFVRFDPALTFCGVAANRVGSARHLALVRESMESVPGARFLGGIPRDAAVGVPERHLGLVTAEDHSMEGAADALADLVEAHLDLDALLDSLPRVSITGEARPEPPMPDVRVGVAKDNAFCFYYEDNLDALRENGCGLVFFSPVRDKALPDGIHGLYLGGGYPELHARALAENVSMRRALLDACRAGMPVLAECGGFMALCQSLTDMEGQVFPMAGCFPFAARMEGRLQSLGYREARFTADTPLGPAGTVARGHEFHYSRLVSGEGEAPGEILPVFGTSDREGGERDCPGWLLGNTLGSYLHLCFRSNPALAAAFAAACRRHRDAG
jgi:cobyrinic acid a,c-diamide synthase